MSTLHAANSFFETSRPWELKLKTITENTKKIKIPMPQCDENDLRLETIMAMTMDTLRLCGIVLQPMLPQMSSRLLDKLGVPWNQRLWKNLKDHFGLVANNVCEPPMEACISRADAVLFKRISPPEDDDDTKQLQQQQNSKQQSKKGQGKKAKVKKDTQDQQVAQ